VSDFLVALGLVFAIEGILFLAFPAATRNGMLQVAAMSDTTLRRIGLACAVAGIVMVWLVRG
jgi:uncharacterized protein